MAPSAWRRVESSRPITDGDPVSLEDDVFEVVCEKDYPAPALWRGRPSHFAAGPLPRRQLSTRSFWASLKPCRPPLRTAVPVRQTWGAVVVRLHDRLCVHGHFMNGPVCKVDQFLTVTEREGAIKSSRDMSLVRRRRRIAAAQGIGHSTRERSGIRNRSSPSTVSDSLKLSIPAGNREPERTPVRRLHRLLGVSLESPTTYASPVKPNVVVVRQPPRSRNHRLQNFHHRLAGTLTPLATSVVDKSTSSSSTPMVGVVERSRNNRNSCAAR